jgi:ComF family protein
MWEWLWQWIFPDQCVVCGQYGTPLCLPCAARCPAYTAALPACGADSMTIVYDYAGAMRQAILRLKYANQPRIAHVLGTVLAQAPWPTWPHAVVVPIPGAPQRVAARGYDHALLLAHQVATVRQLPVRTNLVRVRNTTAQAQLTRIQRQQNLKHAFVWRGGVAPHTVILVDDICTTGATLHEAIVVLRHAGATYIHVAVVARGTTHHPPHVHQVDVGGVR